MEDATGEAHATGSTAPQHNNAHGWARGSDLPAVIAPARDSPNPLRPGRQRGRLLTSRAAACSGDDDNWLKIIIRNQSKSLLEIY